MGMVEKHYKENQRALTKKVKRFMGEDGEDVVQESYARALKYFPSFKEDGNFNKWFNKILFNTVKDFKADRGGLTVDLDPDYIEATDNGSITPYRRLIRSMSIDMSDDHREVVKLHYIYGYNQKEICEVVELSYSNVRKIISRFKLLMENY